MKSLVELGYQYHRPRFWGYYEDAASVQLPNIVYDGSACLCFFFLHDWCVCVCVSITPKNTIYGRSVDNTAGQAKTRNPCTKWPLVFVYKTWKIYVHEPCVLPVILYLHESCSVILHLLPKLHFFLNLKVALTFYFSFMSHCILGPGLFALRGQ